jgi:signal transduction histidine kinase/CheY-like chemotaxis protein/HAMP domain-containing protein
MRLSFRSRLVALVVTTAVALLALVAFSAITASRVERELDEIRRHYLPKVGLRPSLEGQFERIQRAFQDAVGASDKEKLAATVELKNEFLSQLSEASDAVDRETAAALAQAVEDFHQRGMAVSTRLIARETGEALVAQMSELQAAQVRARDLLEKATAFDRTELTNAFEAAAAAQKAGSRVRLIVSLASLLVVLLLSLWFSREMLAGMERLTDGFRRFGDGDFSSPIPIVSSDELGDLARHANQMAQSLQRLEGERRSVDWLKTGQTAMAEQLRGELDPRDVADRAVSTLCRYLECPVGALYGADEEGTLRLLGGHAVVRGEAASAFRPGEGLVGQAALQTEITVVDASDGGLRVSSGLTEGTPRSIVFVPLLRLGKVVGIIELVSLRRWADLSSELLNSVREWIAIALDVARGRAELRGLLDETQRQAAELTRAGAYKSQFLANMSHELRTPLNAILGFTQLLHDAEVGPVTSEQREFLGNVLTSSRHLLRLINDVLDLAKVESGKLDFRPEPFALGDLIGEVIAILRTSAADKNVRVDVEVDPSLGRVVLDPARLKQVLYNYLSNALKFTPSGGLVTVRASPEGTDFFRLEVQDSGPGIEPQDLTRLFVEFQQLDAGAAKKHAGTGLGLALTKRMVEAQGGTVGVRSTRGAGSVFHAVLPRNAKAPIEPLRPASVAARHQSGPAILVIEDNAADQGRIVEALALAGFSVEAASTGAQALAKLRERTFSAVTLDLLLPDMSGVDLLTKIRSERRNADLPIVVVTVVAERGAVAGFTVTDVLAKPIDTAALLDALRRAGVTPERRGAVLVVDDDPGSLKLMQATLRRSGYEAICHADAEAALEAAAESRPAAVVLDLMMPRIDGFEFLERFRKTDAGRRTPVIIWTVKDLSANDHARLRETAQAVIAKGSDAAASLVRELNTFLPQAQVAK